MVDTARDQRWGRNLEGAGEDGTDEDGSHRRPKTVRAVVSGREWSGRRS